MIRYTDTLDDIASDALAGFFEGWPNPPTPARHLDILRGSAHVWLAIDDDSRAVVGFVNAISDGVLAAFIPLLEVLPTHRGKGIGAELVRRMTATLDELYSIDIVCDDNVAPFYERLGYTRYSAMIRRNYANQGG